MNGAKTPKYPYLTGLLNRKTWFYQKQNTRKISTDIISYKFNQNKPSGIFKHTSKTHYASNN